MDPYLEDPHRWPGVHVLLIAAYAELLNRQLPPRYVADIEERVYLSTDDDPAEEQLRIPDLWIEEIGNGDSAKSRQDGAIAVAEPLVVTTLQTDERRERRIEIRTTGTGELVTVIEVVSPSNKVVGAAARRSFLAKREEVTFSKSHWVEIDLLRGGSSLPLRRRLKRHEYFVHVSPVELRPKGRVWPLRMTNPLPLIGIPLRSPDPDSPLELQTALNLVYDRGGFDRKLDCTKDPVPPLSPELAKWANKLLKQKKLR
jgi:hypothetical protein